MATIALDIQHLQQLGSLNFASAPRSFDDGKDGKNLMAVAISCGRARISKITGYSYGNGLYFSGIQTTYEVDGEEVPGPPYVIDDRWPVTLTLAPGEIISKIGVQHGEITDQFWVRTSAGQQVAWGGLGGSEKIWDMPEGCTLVGFSGQQGPWRGRRQVMNTFAPVLVRSDPGAAALLPAEGFSVACARAWVTDTNAALEPPGSAPVTTTETEEHPGDRAVLMMLAECLGAPAHHGATTGPAADGEEGSDRGRRVPLAGWGSPQPIGEWEGVVTGPGGRVTELYLEKAGLTGRVPEEIGNLACLRELWAPMNALEGPLPRGLLNCRELQTINIHGNAGLEGFIPSELLQRPGLKIYSHNTDLLSSLVSLEVPAFPFYGAAREKVLALRRLPPHEEALGAEGLLTQLHPERTFTRWFGGVRREEIGLVSHHWLGPGGEHPDDAQNSKLAQLQRLLRAHPGIKYLWVDYLCVPQRHAGRQQTAINSLPHYIKAAGHFFVLVGDAGPASLENFNTRGWCRLERLCAAVAVKGRDPEGADMYGPMDYEVETAMYVANKDAEDSGGGGAAGAKEGGEEEGPAAAGAIARLSPGEVLARDPAELDPMAGRFTHARDRARIAPCLDLLGRQLEAAAGGGGGGAAAAGGLAALAAQLRAAAAAHMDAGLFDPEGAAAGEGPPAKKKKGEEAGEI